MKKGKLLIFLVAAAAIVIAILFLSSRHRDEEGSAVSNTGLSMEDYIAPSHLNLEMPDTYWGTVDVTGTWVNTRTPQDVIELLPDGRYSATTSLVLSGEYEVREGYVAFLSDYDSFDALRMVQGDGVDILLQIDDDVLPYIYRRLRPDETLEVLQQDQNDGDEILRHHVSALQQILQKSQWIPITDGVDALVIEPKTIRLYEGQRVAAEWAYQLYVPDSFDEISYDPPYSITGEIEGTQYEFLLDPGQFDEHTEGYSLKIFNDEGTLLEAKSTKDVYIDEP